jgi:hypothetical protein
MAGLIEPAFSRVLDPRQRWLGCEPALFHIAHAFGGLRMTPYLAVMAANVPLLGMPAAAGVNAQA